MFPSEDKKRWYFENKMFSGRRKYEKIIFSRDAFDSYLLVTFVYQDGFY